ncbi:target of Nesh-SH3 isoform X37 [Corvus cornix cornix]|uniref:target of Nesh-SH3 isoform X37 n=1 Tax=Corvus cornix cornix TaxID=932674 RepID=UPI0019502A26|nr:target of Nesh-SH3 isoform X37 [Corvus cornix cornix]
MMSRFVCLLFCGYIALNLGNAQKLPRVKRQSLKVQINATDDTVCMRYLRPSQSTKLEGFVLGYGSNFLSNQYIPLPSEGKNYVTELDAEPRYLVSVRPARVSNNKKSCSGRNKTQKPLQLVVGTLTPTSVFLSWGILVNPQHDWTATSNCASDRFYTVRYREKGKDKKWVFQLCPATETVIDNLKPNTPYEFGVKDNVEDSIWSKTLNHKTVLSSKKVNGQLQNMYKLVPNSQTQIIFSDNKKLVPVTIIKQIIQNRTQSKAPDSSSLPGAILVHLIVPGLNESQQKLPPLLTIDDIPQASRKKLAKNETGVWPAESKTPEVQEISPQSLPATERPVLESTSSASRETTRMATRRPRPKSTTPSSLATQQTVMAPLDFPHVTSTPQTSTSAKMSERETATRGSGLKITSHPFVETRGSVMDFISAFDENQHITSRSETSGIQEMPSAVPALPRPFLEATSFPFLKTMRTVMATERPVLESTSSASRETTRMATRRPRPKSTTPSSLATQQTVMASLDSNHISFLSQTSASAEISKIKTVTSSADLEKSMPPLSRTPHVLTTTAVFSGVQPVLSSPVAPSKPEIADAGPAATSESILESFTPKTSRPFQWPRVTLAPKEIPLIPSKPKPSAIPEVQHVKPAPKPPLLDPKTSQTLEQPKATLAPKEAKLTTSASKPRPSARPQKPRTKPAATIPVSVTTRSPYTYERPKTAEVLEPITLRIEPPRSPIAPKQTQRVPSKPKTSPKPYIPQAKDVLESITLRTDQLKPTIVPREPKHVPSKPRTSPSPEVPRTKPASKDPYHRPSKPKTSPSPRVPPTRASPKESRRVPSKPRASPSPEVPHTKPVLAASTFTVEQQKTATGLKEPQRIPFQPRTTPIPDAPYRKPEILPTFDEPDTTMIPRIPERTKATFAPTEKQFIHTKRKTTEKPRVPYAKPAIHLTTPQPIITKSTTTGHSRATMAPKETLLIPSKSKTSVRPEVPQTKPAPRATHLGSINLVTVHVVDGSKITLVPNETYHISPRPKIGQATEIPWYNTAPHKTRLTSARPKPSDKSQTRPAFSKTTLAPARTKAPGLPKWIVPTTDDLYAPEDTARPIDTDVKKPPEYVDIWQKPISVTRSPGPQHPPIPPAKPTQMRRKPLPPNTVTGKPGSPAKPAGPTPPVRTGTLYKTPTAFATPEYYVDATVFSSSPTSETDSSGKPRYQAPHVKYMKKDDDVPCSITSSLEHFPQEEAGSKEEPTRPPQNPPTNLTVVTVEGCPTFVILDWEKPDNDTVTEYEVVSTENGGSDGEKEKSIITTNQTHSTVENLKPDTSYEFHVKPRNPLGEGPSSNVVTFSTESADPRVSEPISMGKDAIWTEIPFNSDTYSECKGKQYVKRTWYKKFVGVQLCNSLRYKIYLSDSLTGKFYNIGDQRGHGEDHCQFVDSFLDGRTGQQEDLPVKDGFFRAVRQEPVKFGKIGGETQINYVRWYECGTSIPGKW